MGESGGGIEIVTNACVYFPICNFSVLARIFT